MSTFDAAKEKETNGVVLADDGSSSYHEEQQEHDGFAKETQSRPVSAEDNWIHEHPVEAAVQAEGNDLEAASKVVSKTSARNLAAIPDGGLRAWMQVLGAFMIFFNSWGIINTYGAYQTYYETDLLSSNSPSAIAWIGSIQAFLLLLVGSLTGPIYDAGYFRALIAVGSFMLVLGHMLLSLCHNYWQVLLAQAFCIGTGPGCLFIPGVAILSTYFQKRLAFSVGVAATGSSLGGTLYPIILHRLIPQVGFPWAVRVLGFICLATLLVPNLVMKTRILPDARRSLIDYSAFKDVPFMLFSCASFVGFMGLYMPFFYIEGFAIAKGITDENLGFYLLSIINASSTFGRLVPNFIADKTGPFNMFIPACLFSGVMIYCTIPVTSLAGVVMICVLYGFFSGAYVSLPPTIMVSLTPDRRYIGTRMGMSFAFTSIGLLIGTPVGGAILSSGGYTAIWAFGGSLIVAGGCITIASRIAKFGWTPFVKS